MQSTMKNDGKVYFAANTKNDDDIRAQIVI